MPAKRILLVRHGRSSHVHAGWIDRAGFLRWREAYEAAGIMADDVPPPALIDLASRTGAIVSSTTPRAIESAAALAPGRAIVSSPLLAELELSPPRIAGIRMPLLGWALAIGFASLIRTIRRQPKLSAAEQARINAAAEWLERLTQEHGSVMAVTHYSFRNALVQHLMQRGWHHDPPPRRSRHWSASSLSRQE